MLCGFVGKIIVKARLEQIKILVIWKVSSWESVQHRSGAVEEFAQVGIKSYKLNTKGMRIVRFNVCSMVYFNREV